MSYSVEELHAVRPPRPGEVAAQDEDWRVLDPMAAARPCRYGGNKPCRRPAVAETDRGRWFWARRRPNWWAYCEQHLYGRWIEGGRVMEWKHEDDE